MKDDGKENPAGNETTGYGKPPLAGQFKKGEINNKKGRPRKRKSGIGEAKRIARKALERTRSVTIHGKSMKMSQLEMSIEMYLGKPTSSSMRDLERLQGLVAWAYSDVVTEDKPDYRAQVLAKLEAMAARIQEDRKEAELKKSEDDKLS